MVALGSPRWNLSICLKIKDKRACFTKTPLSMANGGVLGSLRYAISARSDSMVWRAQDLVVFCIIADDVSGFDRLANGRHAVGIRDWQPDIFGRSGAGTPDTVAGVPASRNSRFRIVSGKLCATGICQSFGTCGPPMSSKG